MPTCVVIIPARYASSRFPGKPLVPIAGRPMIQHVYERARQARLVDAVLVATDDARIVTAVEAFGGQAVMTSSAHPSGTDRIAEVAAQRAYDIVVNVQGDEPCIAPLAIDAMIAPLRDDATVAITTLAHPLRDVADLLTPHVVKVVVDRQGDALYFSRAPIPYDRLRLVARPTGTGGCWDVVDAAARMLPSSRAVCLSAGSALTARPAAADHS